MNMKDITGKAKAILASVAPEIGTALGGPFGALAGTVLAKALGAKDANDPALEAAITSGNPETLLAIKKANDDFLIQMEQLGISRDKLDYDDRASARAREMAVKDRTPAWLAYVVTAGFFLTLAFMLWYGKPAQGGDALLVLLGSLGTAWTAIIAYYYGSSKSSDTKTAALADIAKGP